MFEAVSRPYLLLGATALGGWLLVHRSTDGAASAPAPEVAAQAEPQIARTVAAPALPSLPADEEPVDEEPADDETPDAPHALSIDDEDPAQFALVFKVAGKSYVQLSSDTIEKTGSPRLIVEDGVAAVIASVPIAAVPDAFQKWNGRSVLVGGTCKARVVGFAQVTRATGEPPADEWEDDQGEWHREEKPWTIENVKEGTTVFAGELDGCEGLWARAADLPAATVAAKGSAPAVEAAARAQLLAHSDDDPMQKQWADAGGEGDWRDGVDVETRSFHHPETGEDWVIVQARRGGGCGDPSIDLMAAYRVGSDGTVHQVADLTYAYDDVLDMVDVDNDGQPELVMGSGNDARLVDLTNTGHASIHVAQFYEGCGC